MEFLRNKKSQSLSLNTIALLAIMAITMVLIIFMVVNQMRNNSQKTDSLSENACDLNSLTFTAQGYESVQIMDENNGCKDGYRREYAEGLEKGKICCVKPKTS